MAKSTKKRASSRSGYRQTDSSRGGDKVLGTEGKRNQGVEQDGSLFAGARIYQFRTVPLTGGKTVPHRTGKFSKAAGAVAPGPTPKPFQHDVFATEAEYDQSVENVVNRIKSGQVKARTPDE